MKPGKMLGGGPSRRGGKLTSPYREKPVLPVGSTQLVILGMTVSLVLGAVGGFIWALDRELRGGLLEQRAEALQRPDWVHLDSIPPHVVEAFLLVADRSTEGDERPPFGDEDDVPRDLISQVHMLGDGLTDVARQLVLAPLAKQHLNARDMVELYLNRVHLGNTGDYPVYGLFHGASEYFGKSPHQLDLAEGATFAGFLLEPRLRDPENQEGAVGARRGEILNAMLRGGLITDAEFSEAIAKPLPFQPGFDEQPMARRLASSIDTMIIRLPERYRETRAEPH